MVTPYQPLANESELLLQVSEGNREAFDRIYHYYPQEIKRYLVTSTTLSLEDGDDLVQDIFLSIWERRESLPSIRCFKGYLFMMVRNNIISSNRKHSFRMKVFKDLSFNSPIDYAHIEEDLLYRFYHTKAAEALRQLPPKVRKVYEIYTAHTLSAREIAAEIKMSVFMVRKYLYKARDFIKNYLRKNAEWLITWAGIILLLTASYLIF